MHECKAQFRKYNVLDYVYDDIAVIRLGKDSKKLNVTIKKRKLFVPSAIEKPKQYGKCTSLVKSLPFGKQTPIENTQSYSTALV